MVEYISMHKSQAPDILETVADSFSALPCSYFSRRHVSLWVSSDFKSGLRLK